MAFLPNFFFGLRLFTLFFTYGISVEMWQIQTATINPLQINNTSFDCVIAGSGVIGRQILKLCRFVHTKDLGKFDRTGGFAGFWLRQPWLRRLLGIRAVSRLLDIFYTYYIGGSLTRSDQHTFARLHGMDGNAYRLTLYNALFCGIPCALIYFLVGEGFSLLKGIHSYAELPSLLAQHTSLGIGLTSFTIDIFRAADACRHKRCWAPVGIVPLAINIPTYMKRLLQRSERESGRGMKVDTVSVQTNDACPISTRSMESVIPAGMSEDCLAENLHGTRRAVSHSQ